MGDLKSGDIVAAVVNADVEALMDRASVRGGVVEARSQDIIGILEAPAVDDERFHSMTAVRHRIEIGDYAFRDFAPAASQVGRQERKVCDCSYERNEGPDDGEPQEHERKESVGAPAKSLPEEHQADTNRDEDQPGGRKRPLAIAGLDHVEDCCVFHTTRKALTLI
ncbi:hypothetical protein V5E97_24025 [Singulisphaera sp. Ch08]|uniref:Uncharacterized protein n=1 Tax=Singulisphaera sp. Ch08 TaxID=3120278 RepID=A0AAU7C805_9BACT